MFKVHLKIKGPGGTDWIPCVEQYDCSLEELLHGLAKNLPTESFGVPIEVLGVRIEPWTEDLDDGAPQTEGK